MKKTLFTAAMLFVAYCLLVVLYSFAADKGIIAQSAQNLGLTKASTMLHQSAVHALSSQASRGSIIDPVPQPPIPKPPQA